ncbi:hypothetical protein HHS_07410 [Candidatus Pantoea carbekii]|uniref:Uncharacterized protein n=1 Tax=Candidatus Pantoea carbekii TaxID=1235990 RepID=U3U3H0_9GAMM|nr:hypothetical protein HHS_07410 [Candidatus Pantoea carbekii]
MIINKITLALFEIIVTHHSFINNPLVCFRNHRNLTIINEAYYLKSVFRIEHQFYNDFD